MWQKQISCSFMWKWKHTSSHFHSERAEKFFNENDTPQYDEDKSDFASFSPPHYVAQRPSLWIIINKIMMR